MWRILQYITRYGNVLLFLLLETVALLLVINLNAYQNEVFQSGTLSITGFFHEISSNVTGYFNLKSENKKLAVQNEFLNQELDLLREEINAYKYAEPVKMEFHAAPDSVLMDFEFDFIPARAINNSFDQNYNYITLNRGSKHGIHEGMGLISPSGVVGIVIGTSKNYARAISVLNKNFNLSARQLNHRNVGTVTWSGGNTAVANLEFIPQTAKINVGDTIVTSGYSTVFPEKYVIGFVKEFDKENQQGFYNITIDLASNFRGLDNLYIVQHMHQDEIDSLEQNTIPE